MNCFRKQDLSYTTLRSTLSFVLITNFLHWNFMLIFCCSLTLFWRYQISPTFFFLSFYCIVASTLRSILLMHFYFLFLSWIVYTCEPFVIVFLGVVYLSFDDSRTMFLDPQIVLYLLALLHLWGIITRCSHLIHDSHLFTLFWVNIFGCKTQNHGHFFIKWFTSPNPFLSISFFSSYIWEEWRLESRQVSVLP